MPYLFRTGYHAQAHHHAIGATGRRVREELLMDTHKMLVFSNAAEGREDDFNAWYEGIHIPEVLGTPGMVAAQRFEVAALDSPGVPTPPQKYLCVYEMEGDPSEVFNAMVERGRTGEISRGDSTDPTSVAMWFYSPRSERFTE
jgi:hypothetical protein